MRAARYLSLCGRWHAASLYALLTRFRTPTTPHYVSRLRGRLRAVQCVWRRCSHVAACCRVLATLLRRLFRSRSALAAYAVVVRLCYSAAGARALAVVDGAERARGCADGRWREVRVWAT